MVRKNTYFDDICAKVQHVERRGKKNVRLLFNGRYMHLFGNLSRGGVSRNNLRIWR